MDFSRVLLPAIFFSSPLVTSVAPRLTWLFIVIIGATLIGSALRSEVRWRELLPNQTALVAFLVFGVYVLFSSTWSADLAAGAGKAVLLLTLILVTFAAVTAAAKVKPEILVKPALAFAAGSFLGILFILTELLTDGLATRTAINLIPVLQPPSVKHMEGEFARLKLSEFNHNVNLAIFHLWPALLALTRFGTGRRMLAMVILLFATIVAITLSKHDSSQLALMGSSLIVVVAWKWPAVAVRTLAALWCAALLLVIPASFAAYQSKLHLAEWLPGSARARIILWEYTAEKVLEDPILGVGVNSTPALSKRQKAAAPREQPEGFVFPRTMGHHAHSIFLQTWYELGVVGVVLIAIAGAAVAISILLLPTRGQPFACGAFAAFAVVGAFAWGMWQSWFMCAVALLPIYVRVATASVQSSQQQQADLEASARRGSPLFRPAFFN